MTYVFGDPAHIGPGIQHHADKWTKCILHGSVASACANPGKENEAQAAFEIEKKRLPVVSAKGETATITKRDLQATVYLEDEILIQPISGN